MIKNDFLLYLVAFAYAAFFVYVIPWVSLNGGGFELNGEEFVDTHFYVHRILYLKNDGYESPVLGVAWFFSEPLWKEMIIFMGDCINGDRWEDARAALYVVSFIIAFIHISFLLKRIEFYIVMIFFINPMIVQIFIEQIRIGMAFSFVLVAYHLYEKQGTLKFTSIILLIMGFFVHSSMIVFYGIFYLLHKLNNKVEEKKYYLIAIGMSLSMALFMKFAANIILLLVGDRRANYGEVIGASPITYTLAWIIIGYILVTYAKFKDSINRIVVAYAVTIIFFFFFSTVLNMFALRYISVSMPIIILSISYLPKHIKQGTYLFLFAYDMYLFKYWLLISIL